MAGVAAFAAGRPAGPSSDDGDDLRQGTDPETPPWWPEFERRVRRVRAPHVAAAGAPLGLQSQTCRADARTWCAVERSRVCTCTTRRFGRAGAVDSGAVRELRPSHARLGDHPRRRRGGAPAVRLGSARPRQGECGIPQPDSSAPSAWRCRCSSTPSSAAAGSPGCPWASCVRPRQRSRASPGTPARG